MDKPRLLDLFCGAGGAGMGYSRAGFEVTGVDLHPQKRYPFQFIQGDALEYLAAHGHEYDIIHASPPCQAYSVTKALWKDREHSDLVAPTRALLQVIGKPYVIENVVGAPLENPLLLCGTMFDLLVTRHRLFETNPSIFFAPASCCHRLPTVEQGRQPKRYQEYITVTGHFTDIEYARIAMGIDWMSGKELSQAISPAYTEYIGRWMMENVFASL